MNRNNLQTLAHRARETARNVGNKIAAGTALVGASIGTAMATTSIGSTAATEISAAESEVGLVQAALIGVLVLLVVFYFIKRSMGK